MSAIKPYPISPMRPVPGSIARPEYVGKPAPSPYRGSHVQSPETIEKIKVAGNIAASAMHSLGHKFFLSANQVWLTDAVPPEFITFD